MANVHPRLGALKDPIDSRDFMIRKVITPIRNLPSMVDYEKKMSPVRDQGNRGACVAFASAAVKEFQESKQRKSRPKYNFSEEWIYRQIMVPGGGAYPRDSFKVFMNAGVPQEQFMPYEHTAIDDIPLPFTPSKGALRNAKYYRAADFARLTSIDEMKQSLVINGPFLIGVDWHDGWFEPKNEYGGYPVLMSREGSAIGGHAVCIVGYDDIAQCFKFRNSWGESWGNKGYALMHYNVVRENLTDAWASLDVNSDHVKVKVVNKLKEEVNA